MKEKDLDIKQVLKLDGFQVFLDAEWTSDNTPVSVQLLVKHRNGFEGKYIVLNTLYEDKLDKKSIQEWMTTHNVVVLFDELGEDSNIVHAVLQEFYLGEHPLPEDMGYYFTGEVFLFYSFQDLTFGFGWNNIQPQLSKEITSKNKHKIEQRRSIMGTLKIEDPETSRTNKWRIRDLSGWAKSSLKKFAQSLGISMENKDALDEYKSCMDKALLEETEIFLAYAIDDVLILREIFQRFLTLVNDVVGKTLGLPDKYLFTESTLPFTTGRLVAEAFERYIYHHAQKNSQWLYYDFLRHSSREELPKRKVGPNTAFYLALWSLSFFRRDLSRGREYLTVYRDVFNGGDLDETFEKSLEHSDILANWA